MHLRKNVLVGLTLGVFALNLHAATTVGLIGESRPQTFAAQLEAASAGEIRPIIGIEAVKKAKPTFMLLVIDATYGPNADFDAALEYLAQARIRKFAIVLANVRRMNDPEIIELMVDDVHERLTKAKLPTDQPVFVDADSRRIPSEVNVGRGLGALRDYLKSS